MATEDSNPESNIEILKKMEEIYNVLRGIEDKTFDEVRAARQQLVAIYKVLVPLEAKKVEDPAFKSTTDELYPEAYRAVIRAGSASTSYLQRMLGIGYARAAQLVDMLEDNGVIGPPNGSQPREILLPQGAIKVLEKIEEALTKQKRKKKEGR